MHNLCNLSYQSNVYTHENFYLYEYPYILTHKACVCTHDLTYIHCTNHIPHAQHDEHFSQKTPFISKSIHTVFPLKGNWGVVHQ